jgi:hypothetical protein
MGGLGWWGSLRRFGLWAGFALLAAHALAAPREAPAGSAPDGVSRVRIVDSIAAGHVRRAVAGARSRLADPGCRRVLTDFTDPSGQPLLDALEALKQTPEEYLETLLFYNGSGLQGCRVDVAATTARGSRMVLICAGRFVRVRWPDTEVTIIHEMLHTLGLGENPPSSVEISRLVRTRCFGGEPRGAASTK